MKEGKYVDVFFITPESILLASSCSLDVFTVSFAYGAKGIKIPWLSNQIINIICSAIFGFSLLIGCKIRQYLPDWITAGIAFAVLFAIGLMKLLDSVTKSIIRRYGKQQKTLNREFRFTMFNFSFILNLYANPEEADINNNKIISPSEAALLAVSLSLDGFAAGIGAALGNINIPVAFLASFVTNILAVYLGCAFGNKLFHKLRFNMSWVSGVILMCLAVTKLL